MAFGIVNDEIGVERHLLKTNLDEVREHATLSAAQGGTMTLGLAVGPHSSAAQLEVKAGVIRAMHERVQLCRDTHTEFEFCFIRETLVVSAVNHILQVYGHKIFDDGGAAKIFDGVGLASFERPLPGLADDGAEQASLS